jgi:hypothetical protein
MSEITPLYHPYLKNNKQAMMVYLSKLLKHLYGLPTLQKLVAEVSMF